ncbi:MAG: hypothetical protein BYD32DRAFT_114490 [Podila humilis]|nr:MAG: hypothetical protein BYD32DRAFT_114490 [Podila humilis]
MHRERQRRDKETDADTHRHMRSIYTVDMVHRHLPTVIYLLHPPSGVDMDMGTGHGHGIAWDGSIPFMPLLPRPNADAIPRNINTKIPKRNTQQTHPNDFIIFLNALHTESPIHPIHPFFFFFVFLFSFDSRVLPFFYFFISSSSSSSSHFSLFTFFFTILSLFPTFFPIFVFLFILIPTLNFSLTL